MPKRDAAYMENQRERIMRAALFCISVNGVERTSVADIWKRARLSAGALYVHFKGKDEIIAATIARYSVPREMPKIETWADLKAVTLSPAMLGQDPEYEGIEPARLQLYLLADAARSEVLSSIYRGFLGTNLKITADILGDLAARNEIGLHMTPQETANALSAYVGGMWLQGLALDRPRSETAKAISCGMDLFVKLA